MPLFTPSRSLAASALLVVALGGCGVIGEPDAAKSPPQGDQERAYYSCLEKHGVILDHRDDGQKVDKDKTVGDVQVKAQEKCADKVPDPGAQPVDKKILESERKFSVCMRENGFPGYPDPDPSTGEIVPTAELAEALQRQDPALLDANEACVPEKAGQPVAGG